ncbi:MAG: 2-phosphosulfolactate phosphatase [Gemmatimonadaceae bacterium]
MPRLTVQLAPEAPNADVLVVIDVLRFTTSAATALANGALSVTPCETVAQARTAAMANPAALLAGERQAAKPPGFHLGNSPLEFTREAVQGRDIVWTTTNGTRAVARALGTLTPPAPASTLPPPPALTLPLPLPRTGDIALASFVNLTAVVSLLEPRLRSGASVAVVCSGREGGFALEDAACAGALVRRLVARLDIGLTLNDGARASACIDEAYGEDFARLFRDARHGRTLRELGFGADLEACGALDAVQAVPRWRGGRFVAR